MTAALINIFTQTGDSIHVKHVDCAMSISVILSVHRSELSINRLKSTCFFSRPLDTRSWESTAFAAPTNVPTTTVILSQLSLWARGGVSMLHPFLLPSLRSLPTDTVIRT